MEYNEAETGITFEICPIIVTTFGYKFYILNVTTIMGQK